MRFKLLGAVLILLIASPVFSQKVSPIISVDFPRTTVPTTVITGQTFVQTYRLKFIDLKHKGEEVVIKEEDLNVKILGDFEVLGLSIIKETKQADRLEHIWYLEYTLRIVNEKKGPKKLPSITILWARKKIGQALNDPSVVWNSDIKTAEVPVNYFTTITNDPYLDIRDNLNLGSFAGRALKFRIASWILAIIPLGLWLMRVRKYRRKSVLLKEDESSRKQEESHAVSGENRISKKQAWRDLKRSVKRLKRFSGKELDNPSEIMAELTASIMNYLRFRVTDSNFGTTPQEMVSLALVLKNNRVNPSLLVLAEKAALYQAQIEKGEFDSWPVDSTLDARELSRCLSYLKWHRGILTKGS